MTSLILTIISWTVKTVLLLGALNRLWKYLQNSTFMTLFSFIITSQRAGIKKRKKENECNNRNSRDIGNGGSNDSSGNSA